MNSTPATLWSRKMSLVSSSRRQAFVVVAPVACMIDA
jgi:hypothetical protein